MQPFLIALQFLTCLPVRLHGRRALEQHSNLGAEQNRRCEYFWVKGKVMALGRVIGRGGAR